jgi:cell volume regulation protein A
MVETFLLAGAALVLFCVALTRFFDWLGVPFLLLFLAVGMLAGAEGPGQFLFQDAHLARNLGTIWLVLILFAGGLDTSWKAVRPMLRPAISLSTVGVVITGVILGSLAAWVLNWPLWTGLLLGAILSSTDASAVFSVLRARDTRLRDNVRRLLELESGINDPMAVFLTVVCMEAALTPEGMDWPQLAGRFLLQMTLGALLGVGAGWLFSRLTNRLRARQEGLYPVFALAWAFMVFGLAELVHASGFLAVFLAGVVAAHHDFVGRRSTDRFFDGLNWLAQIVMFLVLGLLVRPTELMAIAPQGILLGVVMIFVARPIAVWASLAPLGFTRPEMVFVGWVGLRGAVPVVLATYPLLAGVTGARELLSLVFLAVLGSALLQGTTMVPVARWLGLLEVGSDPDTESTSLAPDIEEIEIMVPFGSRAAGRPMVELHLPETCRIVMIGRGDNLLVPDPEGGSVLEEADILQILAPPSALEQIQAALAPDFDKD